MKNDEKVIQLNDITLVGFYDTDDEYEKVDYFRNINLLEEKLGITINDKFYVLYDGSKMMNFIGVKKEIPTLDNDKLANIIIKSGKYLKVMSELYLPTFPYIYLTYNVFGENSLYGNASFFEEFSIKNNNRNVYFPDVNPNEHLDWNGNKPLSNSKKIVNEFIQNFIINEPGNYIWESQFSIENRTVSVDKLRNIITPLLNTTVYILFENGDSSLPISHRRSAVYKVNYNEIINHEFKIRRGVSPKDFCIFDNTYSWFIVSSHEDLDFNENHYIAGGKILGYI
ncbi:hypothetical protein [Paenisporosarcina sp. NPDC076898]|uniref:hypothetical protein n=1 Tax=unclassified Paenisporosarcina TaxID=2642018 RepID=UPI003D04624E